MSNVETSSTVDRRWLSADEQLGLMSRSSCDVIAMTCDVTSRATGRGTALQSRATATISHIVLTSVNRVGGVISTYKSKELKEERVQTHQKAALSPVQPPTGAGLIPVRTPKLKCCRADRQTVPYTVRWRWRQEGLLGSVNERTHFHIRSAHPTGLARTTLVVGRRVWDTLFQKFQILGYLPCPYP
ncbi:hypothetical protein J6590_023896 [Homalodisca vitripennis]|nr:hypothetical protein J6590_023896 [Homalodisca vitripennis]